MTDKKTNKKISTIDEKTTDSTCDKNSSKCIKNKPHQFQGGLITVVDKDSLCGRNGIESGDLLTEVNGAQVTDILDLLWVLNDDFFELTIVRNNEEYIVDLEPEEGDFLGLSFKEELFDGIRKCPNKCVFCFVDQQPEGLRDTLNIKDEDYRTSFLHGSFITLTNLRKKDIKRIKDFHLSPLYISVHATDEKLRCKLLGRKKLPPLIPLLDDLAQAGITFFTQIVVLPRWNDGTALKETLKTLSSLDYINGVAIVPVGLTKYRDNLPSLKAFTENEAIEAISIIDEFRLARINNKDEPLAFAADELYLRANLPLPPSKYYDDFELTENGIGLLRQFSDTFEKALTIYKDECKAINHSKIDRPMKKSLMVTATDSGRFFKKSILPRLPERLKANVELAVITNKFLGEDVTVAGLLSGTDISEALLSEYKNILNTVEQVLICDCCLNDEKYFLDNISVEDLSQAIKKPVIIVADDGAEFLERIAK